MSPHLQVAYIDQSHLHTLIDEWAQTTFAQGAYNPQQHAVAVALAAAASLLDDAIRLAGLPERPLQTQRLNLCQAALHIIATTEKPA